MQRQYQGDREAFGVAVRTSLAFCFPFSLARAPLFPFALRPRAVRPPSSNGSESEPELIVFGGRWVGIINSGKWVLQFTVTRPVSYTYFIQYVALWYLNIYSSHTHRRVQTSPPKYFRSTTQPFETFLTPPVLRQSIQDHQTLSPRAVLFLIARP